MRIGGRDYPGRVPLLTYIPPLHDRWSLARVFTVRSLDRLFAPLGFPSSSSFSSTQRMKLPSHVPTITRASGVTSVAAHSVWLSGISSSAMVLPFQRTARVCVEPLDPTVTWPSPLAARALRAKRDVQPSQLGEAEELVRHAEAACQQGDVIMASRKAQEALGVLNRPPESWKGTGGSVPPSTRTPDATRPNEPMFIGPTGKTQTGEFGGSAWIAPTTPVGSEVARGQQGGTPAVGFSFTWGGPARRSESIQGP